MSDLYDLRREVGLVLYLLIIFQDVLKQILSDLFVID